MRKFGVVLGASVLGMAIGCASKIDVPAAGSGASGVGGGATTTAASASTTGTGGATTGSGGASTTGTGGAGGAGTGSLAWAKRFGGGESQVALATAMDAAGDVVVTGWVKGALDFGGGPLVASGGKDVFIAKLAGASGEHLWSKQFGNKASDETGESLATDAAGNVFLAGTTHGILDFGGGPRCVEGFQQTFLVKLDPQGHHLFSRCFGGGIDSTGNRPSVAVDSAGNALLAGTAGGEIDLGTGPLSITGTRAFVARYDPAGEAVWATTFGGPEVDVDSRSLALDAGENVFVAGWFSGTFDVGFGPIVTGMNGGAFVLKLASDGTPLWHRALVSKQGSNYPRGLATDPSGRVAVVGGQFTSIAFAGAQTEATTGRVASFEPAGDIAWTGSFGALDASGTDVASKDNGELVVLAEVTTNNPMSGSEVALARFDPAGNLLATRTFGEGVGYGLAVRGDRVAITGWAGKPIDFGGGLLTGTTEDVFVAVLGP